MSLWPKTTHFWGPLLAVYLRWSEKRGYTALKNKKIHTYVPRSTISPSWRTRIWCAWMMVDKRWATMTVVRFWHTCSRERCIWRSVFVSNADVACNVNTQSTESAWRLVTMMVYYTHNPWFMDTLSGGFALDNQWIINYLACFTLCQCQWSSKFPPQSSQEFESLPVLLQSWLSINHVVATSNAPYLHSPPYCLPQWRYGGDCICDVLLTAAASLRDARGKMSEEVAI